MIGLSRPKTAIRRCDKFVQSLRSNQQDWLNKAKQGQPAGRSPVEGDPRAKADLHAAFINQK